MVNPMIDQKELDRMEDEAQAEWCRNWTKEHQHKQRLKQERKDRRIQRLKNTKVCLKFALHELWSALKGR